MIYLDNGATSFPKPDGVARAVYDCINGYCGNPGRGGHGLSIKSGQEVLKVRKLLGKLLGFDNPSRLIFTSNCTEAINMGLKGILKSGDHVITTSMEHNSVIRPIRALGALGVEHTIVECNESGELDPDDISKAIKTNTKLVICTHVSNVTGTILPIRDIGMLLRKREITFMVDGAQSVGVIPVDVEKDYIDILAFPGHKGLYGPQGTGGLWIREEINITPLKEGGTGTNSEQEEQPIMLPDRYESGTINTPGIIGLGEGISFIMHEGMDNITKKEKALTQRIMNALGEMKKIKVYGRLDMDNRSSIISINVDDVSPVEVGHCLEQGFEIATRAGLHCAPMAHKTIGTYPEGTLRLSPGYFTTVAETDILIDGLRKIVDYIS